MKKQTLVLILLAAALSGCSSATDATKALQGAGYTDIKTDGYSVFGCGQDDSFKTKFTAKGPTGVQVSGVVCSGWFKGSTIRTD